VLRKESDAEKKQEETRNATSWASKKENGVRSKISKGGLKGGKSGLILQKE